MSVKRSPEVLESEPVAVPNILRSHNNMQLLEQAEKIIPRNGWQLQETMPAGYCDDRSSEIDLCRCMVPHEMIYISLMYAALNNLDVFVVDMQNSYVSTSTISAKELYHFLTRVWSKDC